MDENVNSTIKFSTSHSEQPCIYINIILMALTVIYVNRVLGAWPLTRQRLLKAFLEKRNTFFVSCKDLRGISQEQNREEFAYG